AGAIYEFDGVKSEFHLRATHGMDPPMIRALSDQHIGLDNPYVASAIEQRSPVQLPDIRQEPSTPIHDIILRPGYRALLAIPLLRPGHIVGLLVVRRKEPGWFPKGTVELLKTFAAQSVLAIQNA